MLIITPDVLGVQVGGGYKNKNFCFQNIKAPALYLPLCYIYIVTILHNSSSLSIMLKTHGVKISFSLCPSVSHFEYTNIQISY